MYLYNLKIKNHPPSHIVSIKLRLRKKRMKRRRDREGSLLGLVPHAFQKFVFLEPAILSLPLKSWNNVNSQRPVEEFGPTYPQPDK